MNAIAYRASSLREAIQRVQRELGPDAVILRTREVQPDEPGAPRYFEVVATKQLEPLPADRPRDDAGQHPASEGDGTAEPTPPLDPQAAVAGGRHVRRDLHDLQSEIGSLRELLGELGSLATAPEDLRNDIAVLAQTVRISQHRSGPTEPLAQPLVQAGVEPAIARAIAARARGRKTHSGHGVSGDDLAAELARSIRSTEPLWGRRERTLAALVGSSGVGKTTVVAKIAAEAHFVHRRRVGLVSASPRAAASEHVLRSYAEAFDVPWCAARSGRELERALRRLSRCDLVLVDTPATSPWSDEAHDLLDTLLSGTGVERHMVMPATWSPDALRDMLRAFERGGLSSLVLTRLDEVAALGPLVTATWNCPHPLSHTASGEDVPGGIWAASGKLFARQILRYDAMDADLRGHDHDHDRDQARFGHHPTAESRGLRGMGPAPADMPRIARRAVAEPPLPG